MKGAPAMHAGFAGYVTPRRIFLVGNASQAWSIGLGHFLGKILFGDSFSGNLVVLDLWFKKEKLL